MITEDIERLADRAGLAAIWHKVEHAQRLDEAEALTLLESDDLLALGAMADLVRRRSAGDEVYFICNRHINHTNVCGNRCLFCAFSHDDGEVEAYTMTIDEVVERARESLTSGVTEIHIVGG